MKPELCANCAKPAPARRAVFKLEASDYRERLVGETPIYAASRAERKFMGWEPTDGKHRYSPFCTLRCALTFARAAVGAGYRRKKGGAK